PASTTSSTPPAHTAASCACSSHQGAVPIASSESRVAPPIISTSTAASTPTTIATLSTNSTSSCPVCVRARSCRAKKSMLLHERDLRRLALGRVGDLEHLGRTEAEHAREQVAREHLAGVVEAQHRVVERLARKRHLVLGGRQLFGELHHRLVRLQ